MAESEGLKEWRSKQDRGAIMKPETFSRIEKKAESKVGPARAKKVAGASYWRTARAKYRKSSRSTKRG